MKNYLALTGSWSWYKGCLRLSPEPLSEPMEYVLDACSTPHRDALIWRPVTVLGLPVHLRFALPLNPHTCERCGGLWGVWELRMMDTIIAMKLEHSSMFVYRPDTEVHLQNNVWSTFSDVTYGMRRAFEFYAPLTEHIDYSQIWHSFQEEGL